MLLTRGGKAVLSGLLLIALLSVSARPAAAIGFDTTGLNVVSSFTLDNATTGDPSLDPIIVVGDVAYADWDVFSVMGFDSDLSQYTVAAYGDGIRITGPFESDGWSSMELGFTVLSISGADLATAYLGTGVEASNLGSGGVNPELLLERVGQTDVGSLAAVVSGGDGWLLALSRRALRA